MATTAASLIDQALNRSLKVRAAQFDETNELLGILNRSLMECFIVAAAAKPEPDFFGKSAVVAFASGGWARPADAIRVYRIEDTDGERVVQVPLHDRAADVAQPAVYTLGGTFYGAGNDLDPASGNLTLFYARTPRVLTATTGDPAGTLDPDWPEQYNEVHILALYIHMIGKDAANHPAGEAERQATERNAWVENFRSFVQASVTSTVARMGGM